MPERKTAGAAGFDCYARSVELDGDWLVYHLGFAVEIPDGYVGLIFLRSSVYRTWLSLPNCVGVIVEVDSNGNTIMHGCVKLWEGLMLWHKRIGGQK